MPVHDWTRVFAGLFHHFHERWLIALADALNGGLLPADYYALAEQIAGALGPDVLSLEEELYAGKQSTLVVRHSRHDEVVALVEVVSPGNKASRKPFRTFVEKSAAALRQGYHLLVLDLFGPGPGDPQGVQGAIWEELGNDFYQQPADRPLTLASYDSGPPITAYVEPTALGAALPEMPLFLQPGCYVALPLEPTYRAAFQSVPPRWRRVLEAPPAG